MNPRIQELAEQAWLFARDNDVSLIDEGGSVNWDFLHRYEQKFAELIVQECVDVVAGMTDAEDSERYFWAMLNASEKIRRHFGVEE